MRDKSKTIHVVDNMATGGLQVQVCDLAEQLPGENSIFSLEGTHQQIIESWPSLEKNSGKIKGFGKKQGFNPALFFKLHATFKKLKPKAVITHHIGPLIYGGVAARLAQVPVIAHVEYNVWHYDQPRHKLLTKGACSIARPKIIGVSLTMADTIASLTNSKNVKVISSGVDLKKFIPRNKEEMREKWNIPANAPVIGCVGSLEKVNGQDVLLEAMTGLPDGVICVFVGEGKAKRFMQTKAEKLGVSHQVMFLGHIDDVSMVYSAFDIACFPARAAGLPLVVLEAQACGIPVVATDVGSVRDAVCPDIGRVVEPEDPEELAITLLEILKDKDISSPRSFIAEDFNWSDTLSAYSMLLKG